MTEYVSSDSNNSVRKASNHDRRGWLTGAPFTAEEEEEGEEGRECVLPV